MVKGIPRDKSFEERMVHRLKIAQGHLGKVVKMVEGGDYCIDVIHQSQAVQAALREFDELMLENHLKSCVSHAVKKGNGEQVIDEVMKVWSKKEKR